MPSRWDSGLGTTSGGSCQALGTGLSQSTGQRWAQRRAAFAAPGVPAGLSAGPAAASLLCWGDRRGYK